MAGQTDPKKAFEYAHSHVTELPVSTVRTVLEVAGICPAKDVVNGADVTQNPGSEVEI